MNDDTETLGFMMIGRSRPARLSGYSFASLFAARLKLL